MATSHKGASMTEDEYEALRAEFYAQNAGSRVSRKETLEIAARIAADNAELLRRLA